MSKIKIAALLLLAWTAAAHAAITTPLVDFDARDYPDGALASFVNKGSLGDTFSQPSGWGTTYPTVTTFAGRKCVQFNGSNGYEAQTLRSPQGITRGNNWTVMGWVYAPVVNAEGVFLQWGHRGGTPDGSYASLGIGNNGSYGAVAHWGWFDLGPDHGAPTAGAWHHLCATYDGANEFFYVDGVLNAAETKTLNIGAPNYNDPIRIGRCDAANINLVGYLAQLRIYDDAMNAAEVRQLAGEALGVGFGIVAPTAAPSLKTFTYTNYEGASLTINSITRSGSAAFSIGTPSPALPATLAPGASLTVPVTFTPGGADGARTGLLTLATSSAFKAGKRASLSALIKTAEANAITVLVDDSNTSAGYANGVGGQLSGTAALKAAVTAFQADPNPTTKTCSILLLDSGDLTDGYAGDLVISKPLTIRQIPNGQATDLPAWITKDQSSTYPNRRTIDVRADNVTVEGLSAAAKLIVDRSGGGTANFALYTTGNNVTVANLNMITANGAWQNSNCYFKSPVARAANIDDNGVNGFGPMIENVTSATLTNYVVGDSDNDPFCQLGTNGTITYNNCNFKWRGNSRPNIANTTQTVFNDCTFNLSNSANTRLLASGNGLAAGNVVTLNRPTITTGTASATIPLDLADVAATLNISGTPTAKADLRAFTMGKGTLVNGRNYTLNLTDCLVGDTISCTGNLPSGVTSQKVRINLNRTQVKDVAVGAVNNASGRIERYLTALNSVLDTTGTAAALDFSNSGPTSGTCALTHCTLLGGPSAGFIKDDAASTVTLDYCVVRSASPLDTCTTSTVAGKWNILNAGTVVKGVNKLVATSNQSPKLDAAGRPQVGSSAIGYAQGSPLKIDFDGNTRPLGKAGDQPDCGAFETALVPVELSSFGAE